MTSEFNKELYNYYRVLYQTQYNKAIFYENQLATLAQVQAVTELNLELNSNEEAKKKYEEVKTKREAIEKLLSNTYDELDKLQDVREYCKRN